MKLLLFHPGAARVSCEDCRTYLYDLEQGERKTYRAGPTREERPYIRPAGVPSPCESCPKKSPEEARQLNLSPKNRKTLWLYLEVRATFAACLTPIMRRDRLLRRNLAIVDSVYRDFERHEAGRASAHQAALLMLGAKPR